MDDLYSDLENYNDVNAIDELRKENKELKFKVEEYSADIVRLNKELDRLSSDFKKLSTNYSSLLKTSRAEIERKSQIIAKLNIEKDTMVLNSIQNSNKRLSLLRRKIINGKTRKDKEDNGKENTKKDLPEKKFEAERDRNEENRLASVETASSANTDDISNIVNVDSKLNKLDKDTESKENVMKGKRALSLKHRRKSMPATSKQFAKLSSDEEYEGHCSAEEVPPREWPIRDEKPRKHFDRHKISETSGIDEKYSSYHESSRETYYKGKPRYNDKYRVRVRYDATRNKRIYSPDRIRRPRDFQNEQYQRPEYLRHRVLESPPVDRFDPQRRYRERRSNFDSGEPIDDRLTSRQDKIPVKQKAPSEYEVPPSKRPRKDSGGFPGENDERWNNPPPEHENMPQDKIIPVLLELENTSCQSPDYEAGFVPVQPIKEIKHTASTKLEDPRLTSKRYFKHIEGDKVIQSSISGKNTQIMKIDKSSWNIPKVKTPDALKMPLENVEKKVQNVYSDIDVQTVYSNIDLHNPNSLESGELQSETNDGLTVDYVRESFLQDYENERNNLKSLGKERMTFLQEYDKETENTEARQKSPSKERQVEEPKDEAGKSDQTKSLIVKYKIPKKKPEQEPINNPLGVLLAQLHSTCGIDKTMKPKETKLDADKMFSTDDEKTDNKEAPEKSEEVEKFNSKNARQVRSGRKLSAREIVEGDLELSDETTDHTDFQKHKTAQKAGKSKPTTDTQTLDNLTKTIVVAKEKEIPTLESKDIQKNTRRRKTSTDEKASKVEEKPKKETQGKTRKRKTDVKISDKILENVKAPVDTVKDKSPQEKKSKKGKKKSAKDKEATEKISENKETCVKAGIIPEKKTKEQKTDLSVKIKFSDLFGDSSSLIMPEDLGVALSMPRTDSGKKYVPIFEDALDANDVNVKVVCEREPSPIPPKDSVNIGETPKIVEETPDNAVTKLSHDISATKTNNEEVCISVQEGTPNIEVLNSNATKEPDVVKTVIIATGVQPRYEDKPTNNNVDNTHKVNFISKVVPISALATSTPYKLPFSLETEIDSCASSEIGASRDNSSVDQSTMSNGVANMQNEDVPDVRIFVRRRRKVKK